MAASVLDSTLVRVGMLAGLRGRTVRRQPSPGAARGVRGAISATQTFATQPRVLR
jgi:hypothetical protein